MPSVDVNGVTLQYETAGDSSHPPLLLVMGLAGQLITWPQPFCDALVAAGFYVIRFDNRDAGLSTEMKHLGRPDLLRAGLASTLRLPVRAPYALDDMANDAIALLDALQVPRAHVVGVSMGGMIAQLMAIRRPQRLQTLTLVMTHSGNPALPGARWPVRLRMVLRPKLKSREDIVRYSMRTMQMIGSPDFPTPEDALYTQSAAQFDRAFRPGGVARQTVAILAAKSRAKALRHLAVPTQVIHGADDPLIPVAAAHELARLIPKADLEVIAGMGHDLPPQLVPRLAASVIRHAGSRSPSPPVQSG
ncbi:alpha/beta fold hydrolase [Solimonas marina]|uniref:Alpha/beta fold hydrolase n=1 Tax=Solimonas marina TaxID=2714601 RepID=A0A969WEM1_9GAMM|nr:alpha/beta hydrolase [Solimonas marina]NKF23926.1 alpha/beta fold hydrolase [Solimonas marina]